MADRFDILKKLLKGGSANYKVPTERPGIRAQKQAFDTFQRASSALYQQSLVGGVERLERVKDYEEMDHYPEITRALDIYADDSMTYAEDGKILQIVSDDDKIVHELEELLYQRLDLDFHLWTWIRNMCKYGDMFNLLDIVDKEGVLGAIAMPVGEIEREEGYNNDPNSLRFKWTAQGNTVFENYQVSHLRILGDDRFLPYGRSMLDSSRKVWKQLLMAEDAMLIYRISRAPERRVFYVDVGNIPPRDVDSYMQNARDKLKRIAVTQESNGNVDLRYNPESILEDFFIPVRGDRGSRIETLPGVRMPLQLKISNIYRINYLFLLVFQSLILQLKKIFQVSLRWLKKTLSLPEPSKESKRSLLVSWRRYHLSTFICVGMMSLPFITLI